MMLVTVRLSKQPIPIPCESRVKNRIPRWYELPKVNRRKAEEVVVETVEEIYLQ